MSENFEAERDADLRATLIYCNRLPGTGDRTLSIPDSLWREFVAFVGDLDAERRVRRWVRDEYAAIRAEEQERCDHARSAKLVDAATGLLSCDDCGAEFRCSDTEGEAPDPKRLEQEKRDAERAMARMKLAP